ncbi:hypothetical protein DLAC_04483 [Tieghemostelium lacteum]|uniref:Methyltransferase type 11 domain-containing protein n=1 Tax=Tieghemostelium lacteum TaxID=361077 RepID=A0A151ZJL3_TIELA|nr:hypothetical protein DLAC_04483 [Tieghemostelium lacteum]|eukprot:KYQ94191.1 hypothetical protein DLAC_04483 [Tieghemostelium lacteum]
MLKSGSHKRKIEEIDNNNSKVDNNILSLQLDEAQKEFKSIWRQISHNDDDKYKFVSFVCEQLGINVEEPKIKMPLESKEDSLLATIIQDIKDQLPDITSESPDESICIPKNPSFDGYTKSNTLNIDGFLYNDDDVDELTESGKIPSSYCLDCGSKSTQPYNFVSHSTTVDQLKFIFGDGVLGDLKDKVVLDIGSRLGSVLYTGYLYSSAKELIGIEINSYFHNLQNEMIKKYKMQKRVTLVQGDIMKHVELLKRSDVIYMNNVLEFFQENLDLHIEFWKFIKEATQGRKGMRILTIPSIEETFKNNKIPVKLKGWLKITPTDIPVPSDDPTYQDYNEIHLYTVI